MEKFYCPKCNKIFEAEGQKKEWQSSVFGHCFKLVAKCPDCKAECSEWRAGGPSSKKKFKFLFGFLFLLFFLFLKFYSLFKKENL